MIIKGTDPAPNRQTDIRVSVLLVTYNHERYIAQALESVLAQQTTFSVEVLVSEDYSTDGTRAILLDYRRCHPHRIRLLLSERNLNTNEVTTRAIAAARGEYLAILDGDDWWTAPDKLQRQAEFLDAHPECALCFHDVDVVYADTEIASHRYVPTGTPMLTGFDDILVRNYIPGCAPLIRRSALGDPPSWYEHALFGDWPLYLLAAEHGLIGYIDQSLGAYRQHTGGQWSAKSSLTQQELLIEFFDFLERHLGRRYRRRIRRGRARYREVLARELDAEGDRWAAVSETLRSLSDDPAVLAPAVRDRIKFLLYLLTRLAGLGRSQHEFCERRALRQGRAFDAVGRKEQAVIVLREALARLPDSVRLQECLAMMLAGAGEPQAAADLLRAAIRQQPRHADLHYSLSRVLEGIDPERAIEAAQAACSHKPHQPLFQGRLAELLSKAERLDEAEVALRRAAELDPERAWLWSHLGWLLTAAGKLDEAEAALRRALELAPDEALSHFRLGRLLERRGRPAEALAAFWRAAELGPEQAWLWSHLGAILTEARELDEAEAALRRALELAPEDVLSHYRLGQVLQRRGRSAAALAAFRRAAELGPEQAWLWSHLGAILTEAREFDEAEAALRRAVGLAPGEALHQNRLVQLLQRRDRAANALSPV